MQTKPFCFILACFFLVFSCSTAYFLKKIPYVSHHKRYKILYPKGVKDSMSPEEATKTILQGIELDPEQYRLGNTKV